MSVFEPEAVVPKCEVCGHRDCEQKASGDYKARCSYCVDRFDARGEPFIVYCDTFRLEYKNTRKAIVIWGMDGKVVKVSGIRYQELVGQELDEVINDYLRSSWRLAYKNEAVL